MNPETLEGFADADEAGKFLSLMRGRVLDSAREGKLPGHPIGDGARVVKGPTGGKRGWDEREQAVYGE